MKCFKWPLVKRIYQISDFNKLSNSLPIHFPQSTVFINPPVNNGLTAIVRIWEWSNPCRTFSIQEIQKLFKPRHFAILQERFCPAKHSSSCSLLKTLGWVAHVLTTCYIGMDRIGLIENMKNYLHDGIVVKLPLLWSRLFWNCEL